MMQPQEGGRGRQRRRGRASTFFAIACLVLETDDMAERVTGRA
jgi:hypothetical protein